MNTIYTNNIIKGTVIILSWWLNKARDGFPYTSVTSLIARNRIVATNVIKITRSDAILDETTIVSNYLLQESIKTHYTSSFNNIYQR
jgi:hypothetical protein